MTTTDQGPFAGPSDIRTAQSLRRPRRLVHLLRRREEASRLLSEQWAHALDEDGDAYEQLKAIEETIEDEFPGTAAWLFPDWGLMDVAMQHEPEHPHPLCRVCQAIAAIDKKIPPPLVA